MKEGKRKSGGMEKESKLLRREGGWIGEWTLRETAGKSMTGATKITRKEMGIDRAQKLDNRIKERNR